MPTFRTTEQILKGQHAEYFEKSWLDSDKLILPAQEKWDYQREMRVEDVDLWEVIAEPWDIGVYAAWTPYAEFYLIRIDKDYHQRDPWEPYKFSFETYYGKGAELVVRERMKELGLKVHLNQIWVEPEDMWIYSEE